MALSDKARKNTRRSFLFMLLTVISIFWLVPIFFLIILSLKTTEDYASNAYYALPHAIAFIENVKYVWSETNIGRPYTNSIIYLIVSSFLAILVSSLAAYAIVKLKIKGAFTIFIVLWSGMIFPIQIFLIPLYKIYLMTHLYNTRIGLILIYTALSIPFCTFILRNHFFSST